MNEYEHNSFSPEQEQSVPPQAGPSAYHGTGAGRKESPFANSPYVSKYQSEHQYYDDQPKTGSQEPDFRQAPQYEPPQPPKPKKQHRGLGRKILSCVLALALVGGSCGITAALVNSHWEDRTSQLETSFNQKLDDLQKQITGSQGALSGAVITGEQLAPSQVYAANVNSVVGISSTVLSSSFYGTTEGTATGSGFILTEDGYVITNHHVIEGATSVTVITHDGTEYPAEIVGSDSNNDIAVLKVEAEGMPAVTIGSSDDLVIGEMVLAIGNPLGTLSSTQTVGYVSGKDRDVATDGSLISMIQTDAAINSGNSGGPLFNSRGEVVGITTAKYSGTSGSGATIEGIGFAIPIDDVMGMIYDLIDYGYVTGAYMGITVSNTDEESASMFGLPTGAYVMSVEAGGSADRAGIQAKDIIIDLGGTKVTGITSLTRALRNFKAGDTTTVTIVRSGSQLQLEITLDEKPQSGATESDIPKNDANMPSEGDPGEWFDYYRKYFGSQFGD